MILFGTGLGPAPDPSTEGTAAPCPTGSTYRLTNPNLVTVWVGSQQVTPDYAGRSQYTAEDEIYFKLPPLTCRLLCSGGCCGQSLGGTPVVSNFTSVAVDPTGPTCSDADGFNVSDISAALASKGSANGGDQPAQQLPEFGALAGPVASTCNGITTRWKATSALSRQRC